MSFSKRQLSRLAGNVPIGTVLDYAGSLAPVGYLLCDGTAVSRATYSELFSAIGTSFGVGDGSTTFNLPDLRGRVGVGKHSSGTFVSLGASGGVEAVTLTSAQSGMPNHGHGHSLVANDVGNIFADPGHAHLSYHRNTGIGGSASGDDPVDYCFDPISHGYNAGTAGAGTGAWTVNHGHTIGGSVSNHAGANAASSHSNVQPFVVVNKIIRHATGATVASPIRNEVPSGLVNGSNATYTLANPPSLNTQEVYLNGIRQRPGASFDYTISGTTITFITAPPTGSSIIVDYFIGG